MNTRNTRNTKRNTVLIKLFSAIDQSHVPLLPVPELEAFCSVEMFELEVRVKIVWYLFISLKRILCKKLTAMLKHVETVCCLCCDIEHCRPSAEVYSWQGRTLPTFWMPCRSSAESLTPRTMELDTDTARNMEQNLEVASWFIVPSSELTQSNKGSERSHCWVIQFKSI